MAGQIILPPDTVEGWVELLENELVIAREEMQGKRREVAVDQIRRLLDEAYQASNTLEFLEELSFFFENDEDSEQGFLSGLN